jgi:curved DNA-binding protein
LDYKDYYSTLGVSKDAASADIQKAYRKLARKYHPDVNSSPKAEEKFKEINEAHEVLKDPDKRAKYDQFGSAWKQAQNTGAPPPGYEDIFSAFNAGGGERARGFSGFGGQGFSSFFDMLFGSGFGGGAEPRVTWTSQGPAAAPARGADHEASISLGLQEAASGGKREITLTDPTTGRRRTLEVKIPRGIRPGQRIRLAGQGGLGADGKTRGDLYLSVELLPDSRFRLEGTDLHTTLPITPWEAALGGRARIQTLAGDLTVKIPPGSSSGRKIRLRGKGYPDTTGDAGDLLAEIRIQVPERLTAEEEKLFAELARVSKFETRH